MLINPSTIAITELFLLYFDLNAMPSFDNIDLRLVLLLSGLSDAIAKIYLRGDLASQDAQLGVELLTGKGFLGEEFLVLLEEVVFVGLLEGLDF